MDFASVQQQVAQLVEQGDAAAACALLEQYLQVNPDDAMAWRLLANIVEDVEARIQCWEQIARLSPGRHTPYMLLGSLRTLAERRRNLK